MGENNFPEWAKLFIQYFEADSSKPLKNDKDRAQRDKRRKTGHLIVGAHVSGACFLMLLMFTELIFFVINYYSPH